MTTIERRKVSAAEIKQWTRDSEKIIRGHIDERLSGEEAKDAIQRLKWVLQADAMRAWQRLAEDFTPQAVGPQSWQEALRLIVFDLVLPHCPPDATPRKRYARALAKLESLARELDGSGADDRLHVVGLDGRTVTHGSAALGLLWAALDAAAQGKTPQPLMPGKQGAEAHRNWIALYIKERTIAAWWPGRPHHEALAELISLAYPDAPITADNVRKLKPRNPKSA